MMHIKPNTTRSKKVMGLRRAKKVGIVYEGTDREVFEIVRELINEMREQQKDVSSLGFVNVKYEEEIPKAKLGMDFFGPKSLNFSLKSSAVSVTNFLSEKFDLLLDLNMDENPVLLNITAQSQSGFIVGSGDGGKKFRDLYFEMPQPNAQVPLGRESKLNQLRTLIHHIKQYATEL